MPKVSKEEVEAFLNGSNPMERIVKIECGYDDTKAKVYYRDENGVKQCQMDDFYPFCWAKQEPARRLYKGNRDILKGEMARYGIACKGLRTTSDNGDEPDRMKNGYRVLFYAIHPMTYQKFQQFFEDGGVPLSSRNKDGSDTGERNYVTVAPNEQYMISTGKRLFKGYDDYNELVRMQWDLETTGLDAEKNTIDQIGLRTNKGFEKIITITGDTCEERLESQRKAMIEQYEIMRDIDPDVMSGYNSENFDWNFEIVQWKKYGTDIKDVTSGILREGIYKKRREAILKLGGEMEKYFPTVVGSINITDGLHAVRRAMALDSNIKSATLKNISKDFNLKKNNRVYVPGISISEIWNDLEEHYAFCEEDGDWYLYDKNHTANAQNGKFTLDYFRKILENDNDVIDEQTGEILFERSYPEGETAEHLYEEYLKSAGKESTSQKKGYDGNKFVMYTRNEVLDGYRLVSGKYIVERYLLDDLYETDAVELQFNQSNFQVAKMLPISYERTATMGTAGIWKMIMLAFSYEHSLAIPEAENVKLEVGGLARLLRTGAVGAVGDKKAKGIKTLKADFNSMYPSADISFHYQPEVDVDDVILTMLEYVLTKREHYKGEKGKHGKNADAIKKRLSSEQLSNEEIERLKNELKNEKFLKGKYDKLQLPFKILGNSIFGSISSNVFYWNSSKVGHLTTCTGRMMFRLLLGHFERLGYTGVVGDTDGINFETPEFYRYTEEHPYFCNGMGRNGKIGKAYVGAEADVQEFEDLYLRGKNGIDIDEIIPVNMNIRRKVYIDLLDDGSIKLVGNALKSKKMPKYIEKFFDKAIPILMSGDGKGFLKEYYDYVEKIYSYKIPLKDIASVGKIKTSIEDYKKSCKELTKGGTKKSRQAWYELAIKENVSVDMGDTIFFINTGKKKSDSDVTRTTRYFNVYGGEQTDITKQVTKEYEKKRKDAKKDGTEADFKTKWCNLSEYVKSVYPNSFEKDDISFNCVMLDRNIVEDEEDHFCNEDIEYNVEKYLEAFNKRVSILFVCFDRSVRETVNEKGKVVSNILITNPKDRKEFTEEQCRMVSGQPLNESDQDKLEDVLALEDKEIKFWMSIGQKPPFVDECGIDWEVVKKDYLERMEIVKREGVRDEYKYLHTILETQLTSSDFESFVENGELPSSIAKFCYVDTKSNGLMSKKYDVEIGTLYDIIDAMNYKSSSIMENNGTE